MRTSTRNFLILALALFLWLPARAQAASFLTVSDGLGHSTAYDVSNDSGFGLQNLVFEREGYAQVGWSFFSEKQGKTVTVSWNHYCQPEDDYYGTIREIVALWEPLRPDELILITGHGSLDPDSDALWKRVPAESAMPTQVYSNGKPSSTVIAWGSKHYTLLDQYKGTWYRPDETVRAAKGMALYAYQIYSTSGALIFYPGECEFADGAKFHIRNPYNSAPAEDALTGLPAGKRLLGWAPWGEEVLFSPGSRLLSGGVDKFYELYPVLADETRTQLDTPTELTWNIKYDSEYRPNPETGAYERVLTAVRAPGAFSWHAGVNQEQFELTICRREADGTDTVLYHNARSKTTEFGDGYFNNEWFYQNEEFEPETGRYFFTVRAVGDGNTYRSSETAVSDFWDYEKPERTLPALSGVVWQEEDRTIDVSWNRPANLSGVSGYQTNRYYQTGNPLLGSANRGSGWSIGSQPGQTSASFNKSILKSDTTYHLRVRALSKDITKVLNGPWTEEYLYTAADKQAPVTDLVANLSAADSQSVRQAVNTLKGMDADVLAAAMREDLDNTESVAAIRQLERLSGAQTTVRDAGNRFGGGVDVVGAALNAPELKVSLNIGDASDPGFAKTIQENVGATLVGQTLAFSMALRDSSGSEIKPPMGTDRLAVPVKITLPVPEGYNPDFLTVLHQKANGSVERLSPQIRRENGKALASFTVTGFSDFALVELIPAADGNSVSVYAGSSAYGCAFYDQNGKLLHFTTQPVGGQFVYYCDPASVASAKVFNLDFETLVPASAADSREFYQ